MNLELEGKRAWVLGGSSGLGRAVAEALLREGATVAISSRPGERLESTARSIGASAVPLDVSAGRAEIETACEAATTALSGLDIVVVNHGGPTPGGFDAIDDDSFRRAYELVLASAFRVTKAAVPHLRRRGGGVVLYVTSTTTKEIMPELFLSNTMRAGVVGMMKTFSRQLAGDGIRLLCAAPGRISTDRTASVDKANADREGRSIDDIRQRSQASIPLARYGRPEEFGSVAAFLVSARASYMTGCSVVVDGGMLTSLLS
ncbi:MAG: SDR family oxidoreductase [Devosia sp.]